jgi:hypothetical protein
MVLPYLMGFVYILVFIISEWFGLFLVIYEVYKNWYQSSFLRQRREEIFGSFCRFLHFRLSYETFWS